MPGFPERYRSAAWAAWRALALAASLGLSQFILRPGPADLALPGAAAAAWLLIGWNSSRPALPGAVTALVVLAAALFGWRLPWTVVLFVPVWAALFWLPLALRQGGAVHRLVRSLGVGANALERAAAPARAFLGRFPLTLEGLRVCVACAAGFAAIRPFLHDGIMGGVDAQWYTSVVADYLQQWRSGLGPVFVGQTRFAAIGAVMPLRVAPYLQHFALAIDLLTGRSLSVYLVLNLTLILSCIGGCLSAYLCMRAILPSRRTEALALAIIYAWCPAVVGLAYTGQLFMSVMTLPFLPIVFAGVVRIYSRTGFTGWAMVAAGGAACWLAHSPIGFWVCASAAVAILAKLLLGSGARLADARRAAAAALLFLGLCGYVFVSISIVAPPATPPTVAGMLAPILDSMFPAVVEPVSPSAGMASDLQPGWSILLAIAAGGLASWRARSWAGLSLLLSALLLLCLSFPVPFLTQTMWHVVPQAVLNMTNAVPTQRLFPIMAACAVVLCACGLSVSRWPRRWELAVLMAAILWSGSELGHFIRRGSAIANSRASSDQTMAENNLISTIFSAGLLPGVSAFFSYGFMDYELEQRVLDRPMKTYIVTDVSSIAPGFDFGDHGARRRLPGLLRGTPAANGRRWIELSPAVTLGPHQHCVLALDFLGDSYTGVLQAHGPAFNHEYFLPQSGERFAFGSGSLCSRVIPLWNPSDTPLEIRLDFVVQDPGVDLARFADFARFELIPYDPRDLPVRLLSYAPFVALVRSPQPGWFESFRYYTRGWTATVNGRPAAIRQSDSGLITVPIPEGRSEIRLAYRPPAVLLGAYRLSGLAWLGLVLAGARFARARI
jgi:hypothetical protein